MVCVCISLKNQYQQPHCDYPPLSWLFYAPHNINRAVTFILAVILMTGSFAGYLTPVVSAADDDHSNSSNDTSASSSFAGEPKKAKTKARKAPSGQLRSAPNGDVPLDSYITSVAAAGTTKIEDNLYQATVESSNKCRI